MKTVLRFSMVLMLLMVVGHAEVINSFDAAPADTNYWEWFDPVTEGGSAENPAGHYAISTNADPALGWIQTSIVTDVVMEGTGAMKVDYSIHDSEGWGGYTKIQHRFPDTLSTATYDWSVYDSLTFSYNNITPQDSLNRVHVRLNLLDYGDITDSSYTGLGEFWYSFNYILDDEPGWNTITIALDGTDTWDNTGFTHTGWSGDPGNLQLDRDRIKGFALEFSVSGSGAGHVVTGSVVFDDFKLTGSRNVLENPGFEMVDGQDDGYGWGASAADWAGASTAIVDDAEGARSGSKYAMVSTTGNEQWAVWYAENNVDVVPGETWILSAWIKDISAEVTEGSSAGIKFEYNDQGSNYQHEVLFNDVTTEWQQFSIEVVMPSDVTSIKAAVLSQTWGGPPGDYAFDDVVLVNEGNLDTEAPAAVTNVSALAGAGHNIVTWADVDGEEGETYTVYASMSPISDLNDPTVDVLVAGALEGSPSVLHYLYAPTDDAEVSYYYAVVCTDASANVGEPGFSPDAYTNTALGIPTIAITTPAFVADGFLDEWDGVDPFIIGQPNSWGVSSIWGVVDDNNDASAELYFAVDDDYLYIGANVLDDVYTPWVEGEGNWYEHDAFELFFGLYDQAGPRHPYMTRGDEPDYKLVFHNDHVTRDNDGWVDMADDGDENYYFEDFGSDYVFEARVSLDSMAFAGGFEDARFYPAEGMRIIMEPIIHDNDGDWQGNVMSSPNNMDNAWQTTAVWSHTFTSGSATSVDDAVTPATYSLSANYPNPFNPSTVINYEIAQSEHVKLTVFNVLGQEVVTLVNNVQQAGAHEIQFQAGSLASGIYMYRLEAGNFTSTQKMILMK